MCPIGCSIVFNTAIHNFTRTNISTNARCINICIASTIVIAVAIAIIVAIAANNDNNNGRDVGTNVDGGAIAIVTIYIGIAFATINNAIDIHY